MRVEFNSAIGPYKGGLRFHPSVNLGIIKFLGFEQIFKNALTTRPIGGGKGGSDFDPKGKSDGEVMRFCQSFMTELFRHIGANTDVPAGDIGVGGREIGFLFGQYKRLTRAVRRRADRQGPRLGRLADSPGGDRLRPGLLPARDAEGARRLDRGQDLHGVAARGNVAQYATEKVLDYGGKVVTLSDSGGTIHDPDGIDREKLAWVMDLKNVRRGRISRVRARSTRTPRITRASARGASRATSRLPSATQNEIDKADAETLVKNGCIAVSEGANMPSDAGGDRGLPGGQDRLRSRQGGQRRRRRDLGARDDAERRRSTSGRARRSTPSSTAS